MEDDNDNPPDAGAEIEVAKLERQKIVQGTRLYDPLTSVGPGKWPIVYHPIYNISFYGFERCHPFDAGKWGRIYKRLVRKEDGLVPSAKSIYEPLEASKNDLLVVHTKRYLKSLRWSGVVAMVMEVPPVACLPNCLVDKKALKPFRYHVGGTVLAAQLALNYGWAINLGGGFHHCSADRGGGFCAYADVTLALEFLFTKRAIRRAMIVDLDAHQGNGHERDFMDDQRVYILDMYNGDIYPHDTRAKRAIRKRVELDSGITTKEYLTLLERALAEALNEFGRPDLILYNAGTDCLIGDPLGGLDVTPEGIAQRDQLVFETARSRPDPIPIVMVTSGGYQRNNADIIADSILNLHKRGLIVGPG